MIKLDFIPGSESSDATTAYNVRFDHPYTVGEFIKEFYEDSEYGNWGSVEIGKSSDDWFGKEICCYRFGKWEVKCPEKYLDRVIKSAHGRGGWSCYDFVLFLEDTVDKELDKKTTQNLIYETAPKCPFCGGTMLPLEYCADGEWPWTSIVYRFEDVSGTLKACDNCGIVKFYPDSKE